MPEPTLHKTLFAALALLTSACTSANDLEDPPADLGNFLLGHNVVVASKAQIGPMSRSATEDEWKTTLKAAIDERFGRYDGDRYYHLGTSVEGYVLAQPGIPVVLAPKSILIMNVTVWDDAQQKKLTEKPEQFTVFESLSGDTIVGSGYTLSKEEQMRNLSRNAAKQIETYLLKNREWFGAQAGPPPKATATAVRATAMPPASASATTPATATPVTATPAATTVRRVPVASTATVAAPPPGAATGGASYSPIPAPIPRTPPAGG